ncbi:iron ABC transporter permease [Salicibibacter halophilus]|uniref:Iron ABC transporter permease n=1 Tax=Salicibibacter halophilus TaxID=2502791 RepID=A0A514LHG1_9BACI|nr:iron ABC transporter permease [Salicibibacter halophilus]QDI90975.1 iron ABC transporter permease [Salicibibacter halophilus]
MSRRNETEKGVRKLWYRLWGGRPPGPVLLFLGLLVAFIMGVPLLYVVVRSFSAGADRWLNILDERIPGLLWNTLSLTIMVTVFAVILGVSLAWIVNRTDIPFKKGWQWLLALPLVIPPYIGAAVYIMIFGPVGWAFEWWQEGWLERAFGEYPIEIYSFAGVFFVLTLFTFPYVYLISMASLRKMNRNYEEVARSQGMSTSRIFWKVNLPFLRPAIGAGAILVSLYVLSDFGAIAILRYTTFAAAIYYQMGAFDNLSATVLSTVLIAITLVVLWLESKTRKKNAHYHQTSNAYTTPETLPLGKWKIPALMYVFTVFFFSVLVPIIVLVYWTIIGIGEGAIDREFWEYTWNSLRVAGYAAIACMLMAIPIIYLKSRYPSPLTTIIEKLSYAGYALPGVIVALGVIFIFNEHIPWLYNTHYLIAFAFVILFLPQAMQAGEASLSLVSPRMDEAARSLGHPPWKVMFKVILPSIRPGILAGGALVFVSAIKELPATLILRPPGFDTLAVRIWYETNEFFYQYAAPAALVIILISLIPLRFLLKKY